MKRITKPRLVLRKETVRALKQKQLAEVAGGVTGLICYTQDTCHSGGICGGNSIKHIDC